MSSDYFYSAFQANMDSYPCCEHCDHDPGYVHADPCEACHRRADW